MNIEIGVTDEKPDWWKVDAIAMVIETSRFTLRGTDADFKHDKFWQDASTIEERLKPIVERALTEPWELRPYSIDRNDVGYDEYDSHLVWAGNPAHALLIVLVCAAHGDETADDWINNSTAETGDLDDNGEVLHSSFRAG